MTTPTQEELDAALSFWQSQLSLQDWRVEAKFVRHWEMSDRRAEVDYSENHKRATISICDPNDLNPATKGGAGDLDIEEHLVHELIHLHLWPWEPKEDSAEEVLLEQAVNALAVAFVRLGRTIPFEMKDDA